MKLYGLNEGGEFHEDIHDVINEYEFDNEIYKGVTFKAYVGDKKTCVASDFVRFVYDQLVECAYEEAGEYTEDWELTSPLQNELQKTVEKAVDDFFDKYEMQPKFYMIENITEFEITITDSGGDYITDLEEEL